MSNEIAIFADEVLQAISLYTAFGASEQVIADRMGWPVSVAASVLDRLIGGEVLLDNNTAALLQQRRNPVNPEMHGLSHSKAGSIISDYLGGKKISSIAKHFHIEEGLVLNILYRRVCLSYQPTLLARKALIIKLSKIDRIIPLLKPILPDLARRHAKLKSTTVNISRQVRLDEAVVLAVTTGFNWQREFSKLCKESLT
jgi:hypothetical protein